MNMRFFALLIKSKKFLKSFCFVLTTFFYLPYAHAEFVPLSPLGPMLSQEPELAGYCADLFLSLSRAPYLARGHIPREELSVFYDLGKLYVRYSLDDPNRFWHIPHGYNLYLIHYVDDAFRENPSERRKQLAMVVSNSLAKCEGILAASSDEILPKMQRRDAYQLIYCACLFDSVKRYHGLVGNRGEIVDISSGLPSDLREKAASIVPNRLFNGLNNMALANIWRPKRKVLYFSAAAYVEDEKEALLYYLDDCDEIRLNHPKAKGVRALYVIRCW